MEPMECGRLREVLIDHVDGLLGRDEAEAARAHLAACGPCRALQEEVRRNFSAMDAWEEEELPEGAFGRLQARMSAGTASPRRSWVRLGIPYGAGLATAAALVWVFVVPRGVPAPAVRGPEWTSTAPVSFDLPAPVPSFSDAVARQPSAPPRGRPLEFRDADQGILRQFHLPPGVDPGKILLEPTPVRLVADEEGLR
jgi:anti-sigma factor RsiW